LDSFTIDKNIDILHTVLLLVCLSLYQNFIFCSAKIGLWTKSKRPRPDLVIQSGHIGTVERSLGVGFCGQSGLSSRPYYRITGFRSTSSVLVVAPLSDRPGTVHTNLFKWGLSTSHLCKCGQPQTMTHTLNSCPESSLDGGLPGFILQMTMQLPG